MSTIFSRSFQFLGIPPKGEQCSIPSEELVDGFPSFQFLGIPPKGEHSVYWL